MRRIADFLRVLADETRLAMLWLLSNRDELCVCDLVAALGITQSKASRHLATLRHAGLVVDRRAGTWSYYSLRPVEGALERALLGALRNGLQAEPGGAAALRRLEAAMQARCRTDTTVARHGPGAARPARPPAPAPG